MRTDGPSLSYDPGYGKTRRGSAVLLRIQYVPKLILIYSPITGTVGKIAKAAEVGKRDSTLYLK